MQLSLNPKDHIFLDEIDSTNKYLLNNEFKNGTICLAQYQNAGYGRRYGSQWLSLKEKNNAFLFSGLLIKENKSLRADNQKSNQEVSQEINQEINIKQNNTLSLYMGLAVVQALQEKKEEYSLNQALYIKWPNDIFISERKIGGILIETKSSHNGNTKIIIGIGINWQGDATTLNQQIQAQETKQADYLFNSTNSLSIPPQDFLKTLIRHINKNLLEWQRADFLLSNETLEQLKSYSYLELKIKEVFYRGAYHLVLGINPEGYLLLQNRETQKIVATQSLLEENIFSNI